LTTPTRRRGGPRPWRRASPRPRSAIAAVPGRPARRRREAPRPGPRSENDLFFGYCACKMPRPH
jgi:hypothetical protein